MHDKNFLYTVEEVVETKFDDDLYEVCGKGIHYFKTNEAALSYYFQYHDKIDGRYIFYYDNGNKLSEVSYLNRRKHDVQKGWHSNGKQSYEENYQNGKLNGARKGWYFDGQILYEENYKNGKLDGKQKIWHENGNKKLEGDYKNGKPQGKPKMWYQNGNEIIDNTMIDFSAGKFYICENHQ